MVVVDLDAEEGMLDDDVMVEEEAVEVEVVARVDDDADDDDYYDVVVEYVAGLVEPREATATMTTDYSMSPHVRVGDASGLVWLAVAVVVVARLLAAHYHSLHHSGFLRRPKTKTCFEN